MRNSHEQYDFTELVLLAYLGEIMPAQMEELDQILRTESEKVRTYLELMELFTELSPYGSVDISKSDIDSTIYDVLIKKLAVEEKTAQEVKIPQKEPQKERKTFSESRKVRPRISKFSLYSLLLSSAALIFLIVYAHFVSMRWEIEVATLTDSMNAKWADTNTSLSRGTRFATGRNKFFLREGLADLRFDNEAVVTLEGPAEFQIITEDQIKLYYGRLYAAVPQRAIGFTFNTPTARIIDLGTEFGIKADAGGDTYLHVIKGKTTLIAGTQSNKVSREVGKGIAKKISAVSSAISDIPCNEKLFVRAFNADHKIVWRGENLSLASIVAGRDGFQEVGSLIGLDPVKGEFVTSISVVDEYRKSNKVYNLVPDLQFIDGVFVPDGESGAIQITSLGHTFDCPKTSGKYTHEIAAYKGSIENQQTTIPPVIINGQEIVNDPILILHSNVGITFDLQAIRQSLPQLDLKSLKATGVAMNEFKSQDLDFWILVDGQIKYEREIVTINSDRGPIPFHVEISPKDRFLTLIVTDGLRGKDDERKYPYAFDFFYLIKPELCLTDSLGK